MKLNKTIALAAIAALTALTLNSCDRAGAAKSGESSNRPSSAEVTKKVVEIPTSTIVVTITDEVKVYHLSSNTVEMAVWNRLQSGKFAPDLKAFSIRGFSPAGELVSVSIANGDYVLMDAKGGLISTNDSTVATSVTKAYQEAMFPTPVVATAATAVMPAPAPVPAVAPAPAPAPAPAAPAVVPSAPAAPQQSMTVPGIPAASAVVTAPVQPAVDITLAQSIQSRLQGLAGATKTQ